MKKFVCIKPLVCKSNNIKTFGLIWSVSGGSGVKISYDYIFFTLLAYSLFLTPPLLLIPLSECVCPSPAFLQRRQYCGSPTITHCRQCACLFWGRAAPSCECGWFFIHDIHQCLTYIYTHIYTDQNYKPQHFCFCPHFSWAELKALRLFLCPQKAYFSQKLFTNLSKSVLVSTSPLPR